MKTPLDIFRDGLVVPINKLYKNFIGREARHAFFKKTANFIFKYSKETALIMLIFNAISILTAHQAHINGLKKSKRENKDYLIKQEKAERIGDLVFTIIPPFIIENKLKKKLNGGHWDTHEFREKYLKYGTSLSGASRDELYSTDHIRPISETFFSLIDKLTERFTTEDAKLPLNLQNPLKRINSFAKRKLPDMVTQMPTVTNEDIATDIMDKIAKKEVPEDILKNFRNQNPYDEFCRRDQGILLMATIGYTIIASSIIMPILKNKYANYTYKKELEKMGETKESIKRKKRFDYTHSLSSYDNSEIFDYNKLIYASNSESTPVQKIENPFKSFDEFNKISYNSSSLRI